MSHSIKSLLEKLNQPLATHIEASVGACVAKTHYEVTLTHVWFQILQGVDTEIESILKYFKIDRELLIATLKKDLKQLQAGNSGKPVFSPLLVKDLEQAWLINSLRLNQKHISSGALLLACKKNSSLSGWGLGDILSLINEEELLQKFSHITFSSMGNPPEAGVNQSAPLENSNLEKFTINFTDNARKGKIDPIFGRDKEIHQTIDILNRRRKNNPLMVGEAGVGKTAVVEGLALKIVQGDVPAELKNVDILSLDIGLLSAGAGVRGEFENRLKNIIKELKQATKPSILFIDEAHTMIGAGGEEGQNDAANLLKPELARGEIKVLAATTFTEFRKYFEKDPAMARRFQAVKISEPNPESAVKMLRGLKKKYSTFHGVHISEDSLKAACELSHKYIPNRQLPDKAVDLLDTAAARVKMEFSTPPFELVKQKEEIANLENEIAGLKEDESYHGASSMNMSYQLNKLARLQKKVLGLEESWLNEKKLVEDIHNLQKQIKSESPSSDLKTVKNKLEEKWQALKIIQNKTPQVNVYVTPQIVAQIISEWTGIPAGNMLADEAESLLSLESSLNHRVKGQHWGISEMVGSLKNARVGLKSEDAPMGVFLLTGPSGVGKTETAISVADTMFSGTPSLVTINMSEYQDSMSVTQLKGASAGYVGYGDGGVLTEFVRKNPYCVVILDEVEKAHKDVLNMFYQVFDKGTLKDGEGREINFKNTVIIMTSNLGLETITDMALRSEDYTYQNYKDAITPELTEHFSPALLARCKMLPFLPLGADNLKQIVQFKLNKVSSRLRDHHKIAFTVSPQAVQQILMRCTSLQSGARNLDQIIDEQVLPDISQRLLQNLVASETHTHLYVDYSEKKGFQAIFSQGDFEPLPQEKPFVEFVDNDNMKEKAMA